MSIIIVEDVLANSLTVQNLFEQEQGRQQLEELGIHGPVEVQPSLLKLTKMLAQIDPGSVTLILLDYYVNGGASSAVLPKLIDQKTGKLIHPALHPQALIIGRSGDAHSRGAFLLGKSHGFIPKFRPIEHLLDDIGTIARRRAEGSTWTEI
jgi:hypothetical protein